MRDNITSVISSPETSLFSILSHLGSRQQQGPRFILSTLRTCGILCLALSCFTRSSIHACHPRFVTWTFALVVNRRVPSVPLASIRQSSGRRHGLRTTLVGWTRLNLPTETANIRGLMEGPLRPDRSQMIIMFVVSDQYAGEQHQVELTHATPIKIDGHCSDSLLPHLFRPKEPAPRPPIVHMSQLREQALRFPSRL